MVKTRVISLRNGGQTKDVIKSRHWDVVIIRVSLKNGYSLYYDTLIRTPGTKYPDSIGALVFTYFEKLFGKLV